MKDDFIQAHRSRTLNVTAILFMILGAVDLIYGALAGRHLDVAAGVLFFVAGVSTFKAARPHSS
jgi:hypothetical protein